MRLFSRVVHRRLCDVRSSDKGRFLGAGHNYRAGGMASLKRYEGRTILASVHTPPVESTGTYGERTDARHQPTTRVPMLSCSQMTSAQVWSRSPTVNSLRDMKKVQTGSTRIRVVLTSSRRLPPVINGAVTT